MRLLFISNFMMKESDFRYGLWTTIQRLKGIESRHCFLNHKIDETIDEFKPDILISIKQWLNDDQLEKLKKCIKIQLFPDDPDLFERVYDHVKEFDFWYTNSYKAKEWYLDRGLKVDVCGFATDYENIKNVMPSPDYACDIIFAGDDNHKRYRYKYLNSLAGLDVKVYGKWRKPKECYGYQYKTLYGRDYFSALKSAVIGLDFSMTSEGWLNVKAKTFEIASAGKLILANKFDEMEHYFEYGKECVGFENEEDLREKCIYYLGHNRERIKIAKAGLKRFLKSHTWMHRLKKIFGTAGIKI